MIENSVIFVFFNISAFVVTDLKLRFVVN